MACVISTFVLLYISQEYQYNRQFEVTPWLIVTSASVMMTHFDNNDDEIDDDDNNDDDKTGKNNDSDDDSAGPVQLGCMQLVSLPGGLKHLCTAILGEKGVSIR